MPRRRSALSNTLSGGVTRYQQLYTVLAQALSDGDFDVSGPLPSEPELVERYGVSRTTVRRAFALLEKEGRIYRRRGSGTYATRTGARTPLSLGIGELLEPSSSARETKAQVLRWGEAAVPPHLSARYPELGTRALCVTHVWSAEGEPFQLSTTYVPANVTRKSAFRRPARSSRAHGLESLLRQTQSAEHVASAAAADPVAARHLSLTLGAPLLRVRSELRAGDGSLRGVTERLFRPDQCQLVARLQKVRSGAGREQWKLTRR